MKKDILLHFQTVDPVLFTTYQRLSQKTGLTPTPTTTPFEDLVEAIVCQQLSDRAGATIFGRFQKLFPNGKLTPERVLRLSDETIRSVGTSRSKVGFIKHLAQAVATKSIQLTQLAKMTDEQVIGELTKIRGIGPWTAEMFLMFSLGRQDVFSYGDLGLRKAIKRLYGFKREPSRRTIGRLSRRWSPYRTYACRILWRSLE